MAKLASTTSYKRRESKGQLLMDFGDNSDSASSSHPMPSADTATFFPSRPMTTQPAVRAKAIVESSFDFPKDAPAGSDATSSPESSSSKLEGAPNFKMPGKRGAECFVDYPNEVTQLAASLPTELPSHFVTDARTTELIEQAAREVRPGEVRNVVVRFLPFRATLYSFKMDKRRTATVKFHVAFRKAGDEVILQAARLMLSRVRKIRNSLPRSEYDTFVRSLPPTEFKLPGARRSRKTSYGAQGHYRHLEDSFQRINTMYFSSQLEQPELCWSPVRARRILGSYQERCDRLIVSRVFDSPSVPLFVLDFLMYHELLHKFLGVGRRGDGRRCMHGPEFKELERKFTRFQEAQDFIKTL